MATSEITDTAISDANHSEFVLLKSKRVEFLVFFVLSITKQALRSVVFLFNFLAFTSRINDNNTRQYNLHKVICFTETICIELCIVIGYYLGVEPDRFRCSTEESVNRTSAVRTVWTMVA